MDVFISWSGEPSHIVAKALKEWLPAVIQSTVPFISSENIAKGTRWFSEIGNQLGKCNFGIICLTPENYKEPWILFEAGAISKSITESCVAPILIGMQVSDLEGEGPLAQFNATLASKDDILKLVKSINESIDATTDHKLETQVLATIFEALWPKLEIKISEAQAVIMKKPAKTAIKPRRQTEELLEELIELSRSNSIILNELPARLTPLVTSLKDIGRPRFSFRDIAKETSYRDRYIQLNEEIKYLVKTIETHNAQLISAGDAIDRDLRDTLVKDLAQLQKKLNSKMEEISSLEEPS